MSTPRPSVARRPRRRRSRRCGRSRRRRPGPVPARPCRRRRPRPRPLPPEPCRAAPPPSRYRPRPEHDQRVAGDDPTSDHQADPGRLRTSITKPAACSSSSHSGAWCTLPAGARATSAKPPWPRKKPVTPITRVPGVRSTPGPDRPHPADDLLARGERQGPRGERVHTPAHEHVRQGHRGDVDVDRDHALAGLGHRGVTLLERLVRLSVDDHLPCPHGNPRSDPPPDDSARLPSPGHRRA